jgi:hypothetical protein
MVDGGSSWRLHRARFAASVEPGTNLAPLITLIDNTTTARYRQNMRGSLADKATTP